MFSPSDSSCIPRIYNIDYTRTVIYTHIALYARLILYFRGIHPIKQFKTKAVKVMSYLLVVQCQERQVLLKHRLQ